MGCVSDTHVPRRARRLPDELLQGLEGVDLILHAGDLVTEEVLADLATLAPVEAVAGNMDPFSIVARLGRAALVDIGSWRIGLVHGDRGEGASAPERALAAFEGTDLDLIVFGHSHKPEVVDGETTAGGRPVLLVNPGSPTDWRLEPGPSYGLVWLPRPGDGRPRAEIRWLGHAGRSFR